MQPARRDDLSIKELHGGILRHMAIGVIAWGLLALIVLHDGNRLLTWRQARGHAGLIYAILKDGRRWQIVRSVAAEPLVYHRSCWIS